MSGELSCTEVSINRICSVNLGKKHSKVPLLIDQTIINSCIRLTEIKSLVI